MNRYRAHVRQGSWLSTLGVIICLGLLAGGAVWWWKRAPATGENAAPTSGADPAAPGGRPGGGGRGGRMAGPASVVTANAEAAELLNTHQSIGTITSLATVTIRSQISGRLEQICFQEGQTVAAGELLARIDARPFLLTQAQYEGQRQRDQAQLAAAEQDLTRYKTLVEQDSLARQQLDTQQALVDQLRGAVATDQAQIDNALLNQTYCKITAPIAGRVGLRLVDAGNYVTPGDGTGLAVITQVQPISVVFTVPETRLGELLAHRQSAQVLPVVVMARDGTTTLASGAVSTIDNAIDASTGTIKLRAMLGNEDGRLYPNQFVNVRLELERRTVAVSIPVIAVQRGPQGTFVWAAQDGVAKMRPVRLGLATAERIEVLEGLAAGDAVVIDGVDRLREGAAIVATPANGAGKAGAAPAGAAAPDAARKWSGKHHSDDAPGGAPAPAEDDKTPHRRHKPDGNAAPDQTAPTPAGRE